LSGARREGVRQEQRETERFRAGSERIFRQAIRAARLQRCTCRRCRRCPSLAIAGVLLGGGYQVVHHTLTLGSSSPSTPTCCCWCFRCGRWHVVGSTSGRWRQGERVSRCWTSARCGRARGCTSTARRAGRALVPGRDLRLRARPHLLATSTSRSRPARRCADRPHRLRQDDATALIPRFYERARGQRDAGRARRPRGDARLAARRDRIVGQTPSCFRPRWREHRLRSPAATPEEIVQAPCGRRRTTSSWICRTATRRGSAKRGLSLSGGQRQRIAIARALLMDPRVLILDDATASVDASTEARIKLALREVMRGRTTLIIATASHHLAGRPRVVLDRAGSSPAVSTPTCSSRARSTRKSTPRPCRADVRAARPRRRAIEKEDVA